MAQYCFIDIETILLQYWSNWALSAPLINNRKLTNSQYNFNQVCNVHKLLLFSDGRQQIGLFCGYVLVWCADQKPVELASLFTEVEEESLEHQNKEGRAEK